MTDGVFNTQTVSIADGPTIEFFFSGATCRATLEGAQLYAELTDQDSADLRLTDTNGEILADITVRPRSHRTITENVMDIGSALLWSHWRYLRSTRPFTEEEKQKVEATIAVLKTADSVHVRTKGLPGGGGGVKELRTMSDMDDCREED